MRVEVEAGAPESVETDVLAAPQLAAEPLSSRLAAFDGRLGELLSRLVEGGEAAGKLKTAPLVHLNGELKADRLAVGVRFGPRLGSPTPKASAWKLFAQRVRV